MEPPSFSVLGNPTERRRLLCFFCQAGKVSCFCRNILVHRQVIPIPSKTISRPTMIPRVLFVASRA